MWITYTNNLWNKISQRDNRHRYTSQCFQPFTVQAMCTVQRRETAKKLTPSGLLPTKKYWTFNIHYRLERFISEHELHGDHQNKEYTPITDRNVIIIQLYTTGHTFSIRHKSHSIWRENTSQSLGTRCSFQVTSTLLVRKHDTNTNTS